VDAAVQISEVSVKVCRVVHPRHLVDADGCALLQVEEGCPQGIYGDVVQKRRQLLLGIPGDGFTYAGLRL
jgi:hypothetical protein